MTDIQVSEIRTDGGTQPRASLDMFVVDEYANAMQNGAIFPDVTVFYDGNDYWLADGFHRAKSAQQAELETINADVKQGTRRDAVLYAVGANSQHGLRRTNEDKRRAVMTLLDDPEWQQWSDREIARRCCVGNAFVSRLRGELFPENSSRKYEQTRNGKTYTYEMNTRNIGGNLSKEQRETIQQKALDENLNTDQLHNVAQATEYAPTPQAQQRILDEPYSTVYHDPEWIKERAEKHGARDPLYKPPVSVDDIKKRLWQETPEAKQLVTQVNQWRQDLTNLHNAWLAEKLSPEAQQFIAHKLRGFISHVYAIVNELESEDE